MLTLLTVAACTSPDAASLPSGDTFPVTSTTTTSVEPCGATVDTACPVEGVLSSEVWDASTIRVLRGRVQVGTRSRPAVLNVAPGALILADRGAWLAVEAGSELRAVGTAEQPIVWTSSQPEGSRAPGDWFGLLLQSGSSSAIRYSRIAFGGGLILQGVQRGTELDHLQVHRSAGIGVEVLGGDVDLSHIVVSQYLEGGLTAQSWSGRVQFLITQAAPASVAPTAPKPTIGVHIRSEALQAPVLSNLTLVGDPTSTLGHRGVVTEKDANVAIWSAAVLGYDGASVDIVDPADVSMSHCTVDGPVPFAPAERATWFETGTGNVVGSTKLVDPYDLASPSFLWKDASGMTPTDPHFEAVSFRGAVGSPDWTQGWTAYPEG